MEFEWDSVKAATNETKHRVSFLEAATIFGDVLSLTFPDPDHSDEEDRFITIGMSLRQRLLILCRTPTEKIAFVSFPLAKQR